MKNAVQKELFKDLGMPKKKRKAPSGILPKNFMLLNISYEQIVFVIIAIIMLMVLVFSLGVERGKRLILSGIKQQEVPEAPKENKISDTALSEEIPPVKEAAVESAPPPEGKRAAGRKLFTIQLIAYRSKKLAQEELTRLGKKGLKPFIIAGGGYYQICVGEYRNKDSAKNGLLELKKSYKDSFIRKR